MLNISSIYNKLGIAFISLLSIFLLLSSPIPQDLSYHLFANQQQQFGISNFANVSSNIPFALIGLMGLYWSHHHAAKSSLSWRIFFSGLIGVALGSAYYHAHPNNNTLFWDRLPMMISFMSLFVALLTEHIDELDEKTMLIIAITLGVSSVFYWSASDDLRFYAYMQFVPLVAIPLILYFYKAGYSHRIYLLYALVCYLLAKVFELTDNLIYTLTGHFISGHTIKHLLAAAATYCFYLMLKKRHAL